MERGGKFVRDNFEDYGIVCDQIRQTDKESQEKAFAEQNKELETRLASAKVDFEEMELQKDDLLERNSKQAEEIEAFIKDEKVLTRRLKFWLTKVRI